MKKTFSKFLIENKKLYDKVKKYLKTINEEVNAVVPENNRVLANDIKQLFNRIQDKQHVFAKVLVLEDNQFSAYSTKNEFSFNGQANGTIELQYNPIEIQDNDEKPISLLMNDFTQIQNNNIDIQQSEFKISKEKNDAHFDPIVYYDDAVNIVFFAIGEGITKQKVQDFVNCIKAALVLVQNNNKVDASNQKINQAIEAYAKQPIMLSVLKQMLSKQKQDAIIPQGMKIDAKDINAKDIEKAAKEEIEVGEDLNGLTYLGKYEQNEAVNKFQLMLTMTDEDDFKRMVRAFPEDLKKVLSFAPIKWKQIDGTGKDKLTAIKRIGFFTYTEEKSLYMFYMNMKKPLLVRIIKCQDRLIQSILTQTATKWSNQVWPYIFNGINAKDGTLEIVYDRDGFFKGKGYNQNVPFILNGNVQGDNLDGNNEKADQNNNHEDKGDNVDNNAKQKKAFDKDKIIVQQLIKNIKLDLEANPYYYAAKNNFTDSKHRIIIPGKFHRINDEDIENLARNYKDWHYGDRSYSAQRFWSKAMDVTRIDKTLLLDPNMFDSNRNSFGNEQLDKLQHDVVDSRMKDLIYITADLVVGDTNRSDNLPKDQNSYFHVKIPGKSQTTYVDNDAVGFLKKFNLADKILPIFDEVKKTIKDIKLFVSLNNKLTKIK